MFAVILYTHRRLDTQLFHVCHDALNAAIDAAAASEMMPPERILVSSEPLPVRPGWINIVATGQPKSLNDCYVKIVAGLEAARHGTVFLVEHDVLYPPGYFDFALPGTGWWYNMNVWRQNPCGFWPDATWLTSQLCARRELLLAIFRARLAKQARGERIVWDEPGRDVGEADEKRQWMAASPAVDIRYGDNLTGMRTSHAYTQQLAPWGDHAVLWRRYCIGEPASVTQSPPAPPAAPPPGLPTALAPDRRFA